MVCWKTNAQTLAPKHTHSDNQMCTHRPPTRPTTHSSTQLSAHPLIKQASQPYTHHCAATTTPTPHQHPTITRSPHCQLLPPTRPAAATHAIPLRHLSNTQRHRNHPPRTSAPPPLVCKRWFDRAVVYCKDGLMVWRCPWVVRWWSDGSRRVIGWTSGVAAAIAGWW